MVALTVRSSRRRGIRADRAYAYAALIFGPTNSGWRMVRKRCPVQNYGVERAGSCAGSITRGSVCQSTLPAPFRQWGRSTSHSGTLIFSLGSLKNLAAQNPKPRNTMSAPTLNAAVAVTPQRISQLAWGYAALIIEAAIRNQVFDTLEGAPKTIEQVRPGHRSLRSWTRRHHERPLRARAPRQRLAGPLLAHPESDAFLVRNKRAFMGGLILRTSEQLIPHWLHLNEIVRTGKPAAAVDQEGTGSEFFEQFVSDLFPMNYPSAQALAVALNLDQGHVLDLTAGSGVWGIALAQNNPRVYISAVDWPNVLPITEKTVAQFGLEDQFTFIPGDLLSADFGVDYDAAILGHILHSEGEARAHALLQKTYDALAPGGAIAIAEFLVNENRKGPPLGLFFAVNMLVNTDEGSTYSFEEISDWLLAAGFTNPHLLPVPGPSPLIVARKP